MGVKIESIGVADYHDVSVNTSLKLIRKAALDCIDKSRYEKGQIELLVHVSVYRDKYFAEPAFATFIQNDLGINHDIKTCFAPRRTFAFDLMNGALGFLNGCNMAGAMIDAGKMKTALVVSGDIIDFVLNERGSLPEICFTGAALLMDEAEDNTNGFGTFFFKNFIDHLKEYDTYMFFENNQINMMFHKDSKIEEIYLDAISHAVSEFLAKEGKALDDFDFILPPQLSPKFISGIAEILNVDKNRLIDVTREEGDLFNASLPVAMNHILENQLASPGKKALIINVSSGIQVGCSIYNF